MPLYLMGLFGVLWRLFGVNWAVSGYILGASAAAAFLPMYLCARRFTNGILAGAIVLLLLASPLYTANNISPRDALKIPFVMAISALLVGCGTVSRRPVRFLMFAGIVGLVVGIGYGFRSDLLYFLLLYRLYATTRNSSGEMIRKLSVIRSRKRTHFLVTVRLRKRRIADLNCAKVS